MIYVSAHDFTLSAPDDLAATIESPRLAFLGTREFISCCNVVASYKYTYSPHIHA